MATRILQLMPDTVGYLVYIDVEGEAGTGGRFRDVRKLPGWALVERDDGTTEVCALDPHPEGGELWLLEDTACPYRVVAPAVMPREGRHG